MPENQRFLNSACRLAVGRTLDDGLKNPKTDPGLDDRQRWCGQNTVFRMSANGPTAAGWHRSPNRIPLIDPVCQLVR